MSRITPMIHDTMAAGPAALDAFRVPSSQPEPMTEPAETMNSGSSPTSRRSLGGTSERSAVLILVPSLVSDSWRIRCPAPLSEYAELLHLAWSPRYWRSPDEAW